MDQIDAILKAEDATTEFLKEAGFNVQEVVIHALITHPEDDKFFYSAVQYKEPSKMSEIDRSRLIDALRRTLNKLETAPAFEEK